MKLSASEAHGKMFGNGLYFAPLARKALGYTDFRGSYWANGTDKYGYLGIYEVAMGKSYRPKDALGRKFKYENLPNRCQSTWAESSYTDYIGKKSYKLFNEECIIYKEEQCNLKYLVEMDADRKEFTNFRIPDMRKLQCGHPVYDEEKKLLKVKSDIDSIVKSDTDNILVYDIEKDEITNLPSEMSREEKIYVRECMKSNFAESPQKFKDWVKQFEDREYINIVPKRRHRKREQEHDR